MVVHEIVTEETGNRIGTDGVTNVTLLGTEGRMFKRRAIKGVGSGNSEEICWLVVELNGVFVYQCGDAVVVTTGDMLP